MEKQNQIGYCDHCYTILPQEINYPGHESLLNKLGFSRLGFDPDESEFEIFSQGLGLFLQVKGLGLVLTSIVEVLVEKSVTFMKNTERLAEKHYVLPFLKWLHRFARPDGVKYELTIDNKVRNYVLEFTELDLDLSPV